MQNKFAFNSLSGLLSLLGLLTLLTGLIVMVVLPAIRLAAWAILALGILLMAAALIIDFRRVSGAITGKRGKFSTGTTVMTSIFIGITLLANAISIGAYQRFDTTGLSQFTLTSQTKDVLTSMNTSVQVLGFFVPNDPSGIGGYVKNLLKEYQNYTTKLTVKEIDPDEHPDQANKYGIKMYQTVVFESDKGRRLVSPQEIVQTGTDQQGNQQITGIEAEHAFTSALLEVTGITQKKIYFLTGHGEANIASDYSAATQSLRDNLFKVDVLDLLITGSIPDDASALIIAGPKKQLDVKELAIIKNYLDNGGWVMVMLNPNPSPDMKLLLYLWGINVVDGTVVDPTSSLSPNVSSPIVPRLRNFFGLTTMYFPGATAFLPQPDYQPQVIPSSGSDAPIQIVWMSNNSTIEMFSLARTSQDSWLEKNFDPGTAPVFNDGTDLNGPLDLGFLVVMTPPLDAKGNPIGTVPPTRLVVISDADFASNQHFYNGDNGNFFLNLVEVLTSGKELISIERKVLPFRRLVVDPEVSNFIRISSIGLLPLLVLLLGGVIWWRRR
ncbi:MAG: Gldg family protein [Chloroflexota bacterium]